MKHRIFAALPFPKDFKQELFSVLKKDIEKLNNLRWVSRQNWHLTLLPPQYWDNQEIEKAQKILSQIKQPKFELQAEKIILAPPNKEKRMIWLVLQNSNQFFNLQKNIINALIASGFNLDINLRQEKILHLTLARFDLKKIGRFKFEEKIFSHSFPADKFELWQSILKPEGAEYQSLASFELS